MVRGLGPRVPHASRWRASTSISPSSSSICCCDQLYLHPTGQIPAYEWNFSDVNPPVQAWAGDLRLSDGAGAAGQDRHRFPEAGVRQADRRISAGGSTARTALAGACSRAGFSGSTISACSTAARRCRPAAIWSRPTAPPGSRCSARTCSRSPSSSRRTTRPTRKWPANYAIEFLLIARAMNGIGPDGMWDEEDGFYYDVLRLPDGSATRLKVRSMVGLLPLCATTVVEKWQRERGSETNAADCSIALRRMPELLESIHATGPGHFGVAERGIMALVNEQRLRRILTRMLDENEFLSPYGIRSLSRYHAEHPYVFRHGGRNTGSAICRPNRTPACSAATRTGAGRSGCRSMR